MKEQVKHFQVSVDKGLRYLRENGPLGTGKRMVEHLESRFNEKSTWRICVSLLDSVLCNIQRFLDAPFDNRHGTDTGGTISLGDLTIHSANKESGVWYEPISTKIFKQIMDRLKINFGDFDFVDFGSGKGRVLILASQYGFKKVVGVEFAMELHAVAANNIRLYERSTNNSSNIVSIHQDAVAFSIPRNPCVLFFYSPFKGTVMAQVLQNIVQSSSENPRRVILVFYGRNPETIELLRATRFRCQELVLKPDWSRFIHYRCFVLESPEEEARER